MGQHSSSSVIFKPERIADPRTDFAFKKLFEKKDLLIDFVQSVLPEKHIQNVEYLPTNLIPELAHKKQSVVDVLCKDEDGSFYIVEMQRIGHQAFDKRAQFYASRLYTSQLDKGEHYSKLPPIILIAVTNFVFFEKKSAYLSVHVTLDVVSHENDLTDFTYVFLELPKYKPHANEIYEIDRWCELLKHGGEDVEVETSNAIMLKAYETLEMANWTEDELRQYEASQKAWRDEKSMFDKGFDEGFDEGTLCTARNMKIIGVPTDKILQYTGLTAEQIEKL